MIDQKMMTLIEEEMEDTVCLLRKQLEILNDEDADDLDVEDVDEIHHIYETLHDIVDIVHSMPAH